MSSRLLQEKGSKNEHPNLSHLQQNTHTHTHIFTHTHTHLHTLLPHQLSLLQSLKEDPSLSLRLEPHATSFLVVDTHIHIHTHTHTHPFLSEEDKKEVVSVHGLEEVEEEEGEESVCVSVSMKEKESERERIEKVASVVYKWYDDRF
jgi:hypothetical protein